MCRHFKISLYCFYITLFSCYVVMRNKETYAEIDLNYLPLGPGVFTRRVTQHLQEKSVYVLKDVLNFKPHKRLKTDFNYILRWTKAFSHYSTSIFRTGQYPFLRKNCSYTNCYITDNKGLLGDYRHFDAILFDVENNWDIYPELRSSHQKYIFVASESADNYPICGEYYDNYYNWTWSYKVNSDIRWSFVTILDNNGTVIGPRTDMDWIEHMDPINNATKDKLKKKTIAAAWFVSHCNARSGRDNVAKELQKELKKFNLSVDIYGWCGQLTCPRDRLEDCLEILQRDYYFYLSFENSLSEDYVTEKILYPLQYYTVPVVYGGANYSRFLPPGSYLDATILNATTLAGKIYEAIKNPNIYNDFFRWRKYYKYTERPPVSDICTLCSMLNDPHHLKPSSYTNFRRWWLPDYENVCEKRKE